MPKQEQAVTKAAEKGETKTRTIRTSEQQIADLEAKLKATRERAEAKKNKARDTAWAKRAKLVTQRDALNEKIAEIDSQYPQPEAKAEAPEGDES